MWRKVYFTNSILYFFTTSTLYFFSIFNTHQTLNCLLRFPFIVLAFILWICAESKQIYSLSMSFCLSLSLAISLFLSISLSVVILFISNSFQENEENGVRGYQNGHLTMFIAIGVSVGVLTAIAVTVKVYKRYYC